MSERDRQSWFGTAILIGILYCVIGVTFALPSNQGRVWRLVAWVVSAGVFAAHIGYEQLRHANSARATALHTALAVAVGAFGLSIPARVHRLSVRPTFP